MKNHLEWMANLGSTSNFALHTEYYYHRDVIGAIQQAVNTIEGQPRQKLEDMLDVFNLEMEALLQEMALRGIAQS